MPETAQLSFRDAIGHALRAMRGEWRAVLIIAGAGAAAHGIGLVLMGSSPFWLVWMALVSAGVYAALTRVALSGSAQLASTVTRDTLHTSASGTIVGFFIALFAFVALYVAMSILLGPYADQAKALVEAKNEAGTQALLQRAVQEQPNVVLGVIIVGGIMLLALTSRFYVAVPQSVQTGRVVAFDSWRLTRGHMLKIMAARVALLGPALIFAGALQSLFGFTIGIPADNIIAMMNSARANPVAFVAFFVVSQFLQIAVYTALEAGLSVSFYRTLAARGSTDSAPAR